MARLRDRCGAVAVTFMLASPTVHADVAPLSDALPEESHVLFFIPGLPLWSGVAIALVAAVSWCVVHVLARRPAGRLRGRFAFVAGTLAGFVTLSAVLFVLQFRLDYTTSWPLWIPAALGALAVESCLALYRVEREIVRRSSVRRLLAGCRVALVLLLALMMAQPVLVMERNESIERFVAIIYDQTPSMSIADDRMTIVERLRLAEALGLPNTKRPYHLETAATAIELVGQRLRAQSDWLDSLQSLEPEARDQQLDDERARLNKYLQEQVDDLRKSLKFVDEANELAEKISGPHEPLKRLEAQLDQTAIAPLVTLAQQTRPLSAVERRRRSTSHEADASAKPDVPAAPADAVNETDRALISTAQLYETARTTITGAVERIEVLVVELRTAGTALDEAYFESLEPAARESIDEVMRRARDELARDLLLGSPDAQADEAREGLLNRVAATHRVRVYRLAAGVDEMDLTQWRKAQEEANKATASNALKPPVDTKSTADAEASSADPSTEMSEQRTFDEAIAREAILMERGRKTDLQAALDHVTRDISSDMLEAVIVVSDARQTAGGGVEEAAAKLGARGVPVHTILMGATRAPSDAAIVSVDAPDTILADDRARFAVEVRLDGMTKRSLKVRLMNANNVVDTQSIELEPDGERKRVDLVDQPKDAGMQSYRIELDYDTQEVVATNNAHQVSVNVSRDPAHLLLLDGRPTWEFRYLKNLFAGRDPWTRLQYVLLEPRIIPGEPEREIVAASVTRAVGEHAAIEATALPESVEQWLKFDVVILGDVAPDRLRERDWEALTTFVTQRGGTLIVLAGPWSMPHAYKAGPLRDLLPVYPLRTERALMLGPESEYRIQLTADGEADPMMRLAADPSENLTIWAGMPPIHWRQPVVRVREAATVLAFAATPQMPTFMQQHANNPQIADQQREFQRANALITQHHVGLGNVLFFGFNHTWRLRYRTGDTFHHRFWGQIMRWAAAYKMPFGTEWIRLGTGQGRYAPGDTVQIRARLLQRDHAPAIVDDAVAVIRRGDETIMRRPMRYLVGSPGIYEAEVPGLEAGTYTVSLEASVDPELLNEFNNTIARTPPSFAVEPQVNSEWIDLRPDSGLAGRVAALTGGVLTDVRGADTLLQTLGPGRIERTERRQFDLWKSWPLLGLMALLAGTEWYFRKRERLP